MNVYPYGLFSNKIYSFIWISHILQIPFVPRIFMNYREIKDGL